MYGALSAELLDLEVPDLCLYLAITLISMLCANVCSLLTCKLTERRKRFCEICCNRHPFLFQGKKQ
jgi:hypothetical protein